MGNTNSGITRRTSLGSNPITHKYDQQNNKSATAGMSRSASGTEISEKNNFTNFVPAEKLAKILQQKTNEEHGLNNAIICETFVHHVFPQYPDLGYRLFNYIHLISKATTKHISPMAFRQQCERFLGILDDTAIIECYVKMFCDSPIDRPDIITPAGLRGLLLVCFKLAMTHYKDGNGGHNQCPLINRTLDSVCSACFFTKESLSIGFVARWLESNCPRLVPPVHRFCLHILSTAYRGIEQIHHNNDADMCMELATPVLDNANPFDEKHPPLMPISEAWLLASALPSLYSKPQAISCQTALSGTSGQTAASAAAAAVMTTTTANLQTNGGGIGSTVLASQAFMAKMLSVVPSHWTLLYDSRQHGVGSNRFLHHVLGYKGPTLCMLCTDNDQVFCIASPSEWRETHMYAGEKDCCVIQVLPKFSLIETGPKLLYLNTSMRGYPKGLRAGSNPRKPVISVDEYFEKIDCHGISSVLESIEVWGCGDKQSRDVQLDIKKWQVKEAERQRTVKLTAADWIDNPDRYLLELGGRPQYNNS